MGNVRVGVIAFNDLVKIKGYEWVKDAQLTPLLAYQFDIFWSQCGCIFRTVFQYWPPGHDAELPGLQPVHTFAIVNDMYGIVHVNRLELHGQPQYQPVDVYRAACSEVQRRFGK